MLTDTDKQELAQRVRTMQIIVAALALGMTVPLILFLVSIKSELPPEPLFLYVGVGFAVLSVMGRLVVPGIIWQQARSVFVRGETPSNIPSQNAELSPSLQLSFAYQTKLIIGCALIEGSGLANIVLYVVNAHIAHLIIGAVCIALVMMQFPTYHHVEQWIQDEWQDIERERQFG